jgi:transcriptional regulator with XRE-family HTH domain
MAKQLVTAVASAVRHYRKALNMSQEELAEVARLDRTYISGVERGVRNITLDSLEMIITALGISPAEFLAKVSEEIHG